MPQISDEADFEISQAVKGKNKQSVQYEVLEETATVMNTMTNWEVLFIQFKDPSGKSFPPFCPTSLGTMFGGHARLLQKKDVYWLLVAHAGKLLPVKVTQPSLLEDEEEDLPRSRPVPSTDEAPPLNKGKRKAPDE